MHVFDEQKSNWIRIISLKVFLTVDMKPFSAFYQWQYVNIFLHPFKEPINRTYQIRSDPISDQFW